MSHSCGRYSLEQHFVARPETTQQLFDALREFVARVGPVECYAERSRIVFQARGRFLAVVPRRHWLACHLWLKRELPHPRYHRIESLAGRDFVHHFRLSSASELDDEFLEHVRESYEVGSQRWAQ
jgi:hypothetical protein